MAAEISLCMIVKNEEDTLGRCLAGVRPYVEEIVVVDTGSTDKTTEIARQYADKVSFFEWTDDFSAARNFSFAQATREYVMWLDADDVITEENGKKLLALKERIAEEKPDFVMCRYDAAFDADGNSTYTYFRERIMRRAAAPEWKGCVHECVLPSGKIIRSDFAVQHRKIHPSAPNRNLEIYCRNIEKGMPLSPRDKFYFGRELYYNKVYDKAVEILENMTGDIGGWYVNKIEACRILSLCHSAQNRPDDALKSLFRSFMYGEPRAGVVCRIARLFKERKRYDEAVFWYGCALNCRDHSQEGDFENPRDRDLNPLLGLTECCYLAGRKKDSRAYHERLAQLFPDDPVVRSNGKFFAAHPDD